jgi:hypothetical protein
MLAIVEWGVHGSFQASQESGFTTLNAAVHRRGENENERGKKCRPILSGDSFWNLKLHAPGLSTAPQNLPQTLTQTLNS